MGRLGKITRRTFLVTGVAVAGGVAFGAYKMRQTPPNPLRPAEGSHALNAWVIVDQDGVTIATGRAEMGQGSQSSLAALAADELDVAWEDVRVIHGPPAQAYFNSGLMEGMSTTPHYQIASDERHMSPIVAALPKLLSLQMTGGSTAMIDGYEKLRQAGATARETLKEVAASRLGLARAELATENGMVIAPDGTKIAYADLAQDAAQIDPVQDVELRAPSDWKYIGKGMPRLDMVAKSTGTAEYAIDVRLPGMKFASVRRNPAHYAGMKSFDASAALEMPGVEKVFGIGDGIAVVATNTWLAFEAAKAVDVEWEEAPYPHTTEGLFAEMEKAFDGKRNSKLRDQGDVNTASGTRVTAEYRVPFVSHATMEPMTAVVHREGEKLTAWAGAQGPIIARDKMAKEAGVKSENTTLNVTFLGGGYGRRGEVDFCEIAGRVAKEMDGVPVKVTWSREEDMTHDLYRPNAIARMSGTVENGRASSLHGRVASRSVGRESGKRLAGFAPPGPDKILVEGMYDQPYDIPNYLVEGYIAENGPMISFWRSVGASYNGFFMESFVDELAVEAGADPLEFRLNMMESEHPASANLLRAVRDMSNWTGQTPSGVGRGVALTYSFGTPVAVVVEVQDEDGQIRISNAWMACDTGRILDPEIIRAQMESGLIYGLSAAVMEEITFSNGAAEQENFPDHDALRMHNCPKIEVAVFDNNGGMGGAGEPGTPPSMPALANAVYDLTGQRPRELPLSKSFDFIL